MNEAQSEVMIEDTTDDTEGNRELSHLHSTISLARTPSVHPEHQCVCICNLCETQLMAHMESRRVEEQGKRLTTDASL